MSFYPMLTAFLFFAQGEEPPSVQVQWELSRGLAYPESVSYDPQQSCLFVSNRGESPGNGFIAQIAMSGQLRENRWAAGFQRPAGLAAHGTTLFLVDGKNLVAIDAASGKQKQRFAGAEPKSLRNVAVASDGQVFLSDLEANRIYTVRGENLATFSSGPHLHQPNALFYAEGQLFIACWGGPVEKGEIRVLPAMPDATTSLWSNPIGRLSGIAADGRDGFFVCDQQTGTLFWVSPSGLAKRLTDLGSGVAGLCFVGEQGLLVAANPERGTLVALKISFRD